MADSKATTAEETSEHARDRLASYIASAAKLRLEIAPLEEDRRFEERGGVTLYAVDANVVYMYLAPHKLGPRSERGRGGFGLVFEDDPPEASSALAASLSRYIFFHLISPAKPLALLIGHESEARSILNNLSRRLGDELRDLQKERDRISAFMEKIATELSQCPGEERILRLRQYAPTIVQALFYETGAAAELLRYLQLLDNDKLERFTGLLERPSYFSLDVALNDRIRAACAIPSSARGMVQESSARLQWLDAISDEKRGGRVLSERADAAALARLQLINRVLERYRYRLVLITADEALHRAADKHPSGVGEETFGERYLRHPRAFLSVPSVLIPRGSSGLVSAGKDSGIIVEWLDLLLASYAPPPGTSPKYLRILRTGADQTRAASRKEVIAAIHLDPKTPDRIREQWRAHLKGISDAGALAGGYLRRQFNDLVSAAGAETLSNALSDLTAQVMVEMENTWSAFLETAARVGMELSWADEEASYRRRRSAPILIFESFPATTRFSEIVRRSASVAHIDPNDYAKNLEQIALEDSSGYARTLAYGVAFAHAGKWHVTALLAARAIDIAEGKTSSSGARSPNITGREAYYLRAVSLRFSARFLTDLDGLEALIDKASTAELVDRKRNPASRAAFRFVAERFSIEINRVYFDFFLSGDRLVADQSMTRALKLIGALERFVADTLREPDTLVRASVIQAALTNMFMLCACGENFGHLGPREREIASRHLQLFLDQAGVQGKNEDGKVATTWLVMAVGWYARLYCGRVDRWERAIIIDELAELRAAIREEEDLVLVAPYDRQRFALLVDLTQQRLIES